MLNNNQVTSLSAGSAGGIASAFNRWVKDNDKRIQHIESVFPYFNGSQHNLIVHWRKVREEENETST